MSKFKSENLLLLVLPLIAAVFTVILCGSILTVNKSYLAKKTREFKASFIEDIREELQFNSKSEVFVSLLKISSAYDKNGAIKLSRMGRANDGGYVVPEKALESADVLLGYGIADDQSFEEGFSKAYNKPSYGFDCGISDIKSTSNLFNFINECIGTDQFLYSGRNSSQKITSFSTQLKNLDLTGKKIFLKMDIEGAEYEAFEDIYKYHSNITGIVMEIHFHNTQTLDRAISLLKELNKNFVLVHLHGNNAATHHSFMTKNSSGLIPKVMELSYIHKSLVTSYKLSDNQKHPTELDMPNLVGLEDMKFEIW